MNLFTYLLYYLHQWQGRVGCGLAVFAFCICMECPHKLPLVGKAYSFVAICTISSFIILCHLCVVCLYTDMGWCVSRWAGAERICSGLWGAERERLWVSDDRLGQHSANPHASPSNTHLYLLHTAMCAHFHWAEKQESSTHRETNRGLL